MAICKPRSTAYYYDCGRDRVRIVICIPEGELRRRVRAKKVKPEILKHYPDGLDFEVTADQLLYHKTRYGLEIRVDPEVLQAAFETYRRQEGAKLPRNGLLRTSFLNSLAKEVGPRLPARGRPKGLSGPPASRIAAQHRVQVERRRVIETKLASLAKKLAPPEVEMTKGESASAVFLRMQQRARKGGR